MAKYNKMAVVLKGVIDKYRDEHEAIKYMHYNIDDSEGSRLLMEDTKNRPFYRQRYLNQESLAFRNSIFKDNDDK